MDAPDTQAALVEKILMRYYSPLVVAFMRAEGTKTTVLGTRRYREASPELRRLGVDVDAWPVAPAGLFVVAERAVYLRSVDPMTVVHEHAHALDCALGGGVYRSGYDPRIRSAFSGARAFVTPYAASGLDEYFAECVRAFCGANVPSSPWPAATPDRLRKLDPTMFAITGELFAEAERRALHQ